MLLVLQKQEAVSTLFLKKKSSPETLFFKKISSSKETINITLQESENVQIYASHKLDYFKNVFNDFLKNIDNVHNSQEIFKNLIKKHYEKDYLPSWNKRNNSNYENLKWEINEAFYLAGLKVIFKKKEAA